MQEYEVFFRLAQEMGVALTWTNHHGVGKFIESPGRTLALDMGRIPRLASSMRWLHSIRGFRSTK